MALTMPGVSECYVDLLRAFPLRPIRTPEQAQVAYEVMDQLLDGRAEECGDDGQDYLTVLGYIIAAYEDAQPQPPPVRGRELLAYLIEENGLHQSDLADLFSGKSVISEVLSGKRRLGLNHIRALSAHFGLPVDAFIEVPKGENEP